MQAHTHLHLALALAPILAIALTLARAGRMLREEFVRFYVADMCFLTYLEPGFEPDQEAKPAMSMPDFVLA